MGTSLSLSLSVSLVLLLLLLTFFPPMSLLSYSDESEPKLLFSSSDPESQQKSLLSNLDLKYFAVNAHKFNYR